MKRVFSVRSLASKVSHIVTNLFKTNHPIQGLTKKKPAPPGSRRLRIEDLEARELLTVTVGEICGPPTYEQFLVRQLAAACVAEQASPQYAAPFINSLNEANAESNSIIPLTEEDVRDSHSPSTAESDEQFANQVVYISGKPYLPLSFVQKNQMYLESDNVEEPIDPPADEETPTWDLELQITRYCADPSATTPDGVAYALHEGHGSVLSFPGSLGDPASSDYLTVTLPALPDGYMATVTLGGTASASDYYVYIPYTGGSTSVYNGYVHFGNAVTLYIVPIDDRETESLETVTLAMGAPYHNDYAEPETIYSFNNINTSVTATIVDNDDWKIAVYPVVDDSELGYTVLTEEDQTEASFRVARVDAGSGYGEDKHYAIDATVRFEGTATARGYDADYYVYLNNSDGSRTLMTPNYSGDVTVRIPENELYATITIKARDDSTVERLLETIEIKVASAVSYPLYYITYAASTESAYVKIKDNDVFHVTQVKFLNNLDLVSDSTDSFHINWKNRTHWYANNSTQTLPVAYSNDATMKCQITLDGVRDYTQVYEVRMKWNRLNGSPVYSDWLTVSNHSSSVVVELNSSFASIFGRTQAYSDLSSEIDWEFRVYDDADRGTLGDMGTSSNPLYVTYKAPLLGSNNYLSLVHLGCTAAYVASASSDADAFQAIWNVISLKSINKVKLANGVITTGDRLYYYGRDVSSEGWYSTLTAILTVTELDDGTYLVDQTPSLARELERSINPPYGTGTTQALLYYADGRCGCWQDFVYNLFRIQGLTVDKIDVTIDDNLSFKVNPNLTGQGGIVPRENIWGAHALIRYNGVIYDPSYGVCYGVQSQALASFVDNLHSIGETFSEQYDTYGRVYRPQVYAPTISTDLFTLS